MFQDGCGKLVPGLVPGLGCCKNQIRVVLIGRDSVATYVSSSTWLCIGPGGKHSSSTSESRLGADRQENLFLLQEVFSNPVARVTSQLLCVRGVFCRCVSCRLRTSHRCSPLHLANTQRAFGATLSGNGQAQYINRQVNVLHSGRFDIFSALHL